MKSSAVVFLVATVVGSTLAFNFGETFLDSLISEDVHSAPSPTVSRFVRGASSGQGSGNDFSLLHKMKSCCQTGMLDLFKFKGVLYDCFDQVSKNTDYTADEEILKMDMFSCSKANVMRMIYTCTCQCVGVQMKLFDENGIPQVENIKNTLKQSSSQTVVWVKRITDRVVDNCARSLNNTVLSAPETGDMKCRTSAADFKHCLWIQLQMNCPEADRKTDTSYCKRVQASLDKLRSQSTS